MDWRNPWEVIALQSWQKGFKNAGLAALKYLWIEYLYNDWSYQCSPIMQAFYQFCQLFSRVTSIFWMQAYNFLELFFLQWTTTCVWSIHIGKKSKRWEHFRNVRIQLLIHKIKASLVQNSKPLARSTQYLHISAVLTMLSLFKLDREITSSAQASFML